MQIGWLGIVTKLVANEFEIEVNLTLAALCQFIA
jgi:hypothetical protein